MSIIDINERLTKNKQMVKLSRSAIEQNLNCSRCFWYAYNHKVRPPSLPFTLNSAVDNLCKNEFDFYRAKQEPHPMFAEHNIDAIPFAHEKMDEWRNNFKGIRFLDEGLGINFGGAVDDIWQKPNGELIVVDVKATSKNEFNWEDTFSKWEYAKGYKRQLEMYQYLLKKNGFEVASEGYLVYYNGRKNESMFEQSLHFDLHLVRLECDDDWVEKAIINAREVLLGPLPKASPSCENCNYLKKRWEVAQKNVEDM